MENNLIIYSFNEYTINQGLQYLYNTDLVQILKTPSPINFVYDVNSGMVERLETYNPVQEEMLEYVQGNEHPDLFNSGLNVFLVNKYGVYIHIASEEELHYIAPNQVVLPDKSLPTHLELVDSAETQSYALLQVFSSENRPLFPFYFVFYRNSIKFSLQKVFQRFSPVFLNFMGETIDPMNELELIRQICNGQVCIKFQKQLPAIDIKMIEQRKDFIQQLKNRIYDLAHLFEEISEEAIKFIREYELVNELFLQNFEQHLGEIKAVVKIFAQDINNPTISFGSQFRNISALKIFTNYLQDYQAIKQGLEANTQTAQLYSMEVNLMDLLDLPFQRVYELQKFTEGILESTPYWHPDYQSTIDINRSLKKIFKSTNEPLKNNELCLKFNEIRNTCCNPGEPELREHIIPVDNLPFKGIDNREAFITLFKDRIWIREQVGPKWKFVKSFRLESTMMYPVSFDRFWLCSYTEAYFLSCNQNLFNIYKPIAKEIFSQDSVRMSVEEEGSDFLMNHSMVIHDNFIYLVGGIDSNNEYNKFIFIVDPERVCTKIEAAFGGRSNCALCFYQSSVFVYGGMRNGEHLNDLWRFDLDGGNQRQIPIEDALKKPLHNPTMSSDGHRLFIGGDFDDVLFHVFVYSDGVIQPFTKIQTPMSVTLPGAKLVMYEENRGLVIGGEYSKSGMMNHSVYKVDESGELCPTFTRGLVPARRSGHTVLLVKGMVVVYGGEENWKPCMLRLDTKSWCYLNSRKLKKITHFAGATDGERIYIHGGMCDLKKNCSLKIITLTVPEVSEKPADFPKNSPLIEIIADNHYVNDMGPV